jgi:hypothetical protein
MPKKALMIASSYGESFQDAKEFGWQINAKAGVQWQQLVEKKVCHGNKHNMQKQWEILFHKDGL